MAAPGQAPHQARQVLEAVSKEKRPAAMSVVLLIRHGQYMESCRPAGTAGCNGGLSQGRPQTERAKAGLLDHHDERRIPCDVDLRTVVITRG
jgi:hypothetical protein